MRDRLPEPGKENRVRITQDDGKIVEGVLSYADGATVQGSTYCKANVLPDEVCDILHLDSRTAEPKDAFYAVSGSRIAITFDGDFAGQIWHVDGGDEHHSGTVPDTKVVHTVFMDSQKTYTISCTSKDGSVYKSEHAVSYFGNYSYTLKEFVAVLNVTVSPGVLTTATGVVGTYSAAAGSNGVARIIIKQPGTYTVTAQSFGDAVVNVTSAGSTYTAALPTSILDNNSWETIRDFTRRGKAASLWSVGDKKRITVTGQIGTLDMSSGYTYYAFIIGFDHNSTLEGSNTVHFMCGKNASNTNVCLVDSFYSTESSNDGAFNHNRSRNSSGGWSSSRLKARCVEFYNSIDPDLKRVITPMTKYTDNTGNGSTWNVVTQTMDTVSVLAEFEVFGTRYRANEYEQSYQKQYDFFKNGNSKVVHVYHNLEAAAWWTRSASVSNGYLWCEVIPSGGPSDDYPNKSKGFAPIFKVS